MVFYGTLFPIFSIVIGSMIYFFLPIRQYLNLKNYKANEYLDKIRANFYKNPYLYLFVIRLTPGIPFLIQNFIINILYKDKKKYFISTFLGLLPIVSLMNFAGKSLNKTFLMSFEQIKIFENVYFYLFFFILIFIFLINKFLIKFFFDNR